MARYYVATAVLTDGKKIFYNQVTNRKGLVKYLENNVYGFAYVKFYECASREDAQGGFNSLYSPGKGWQSVVDLARKNEKPLFKQFSKTGQIAKGRKNVVIGTITIYNREGWGVMGQNDVYDLRVKSYNKKSIVYELRTNGTKKAKELFLGDLAAARTWGLKVYVDIP